VFILPGALAERSEAIADGLVGSVTLGAGQFCTNPGLTVLPHSREAEHFLNQVGERVAAAGPCTVVHPGIKSSYEERLSAATAAHGVAVAARALAEGAYEATTAAAVLLRTDAATYAGSTALHEEIYGPATVAVTCTSREELLDLARSLDGHLTATIQGTDSDLAEWADLVAILRDKAGRLLFNGFPTGVEVCASMQHGGPYPATTDSRSTSVGTAAIYRFARPVAYQDFPDSALPAELQSGNPTGIWRLVDSELTRDAH
jgi:NADP-dependent aldehyde dehydrogenase